MSQIRYWYNNFSNLMYKKGTKEKGRKGGWKQKYNLSIQYCFLPCLESKWNLKPASVSNTFKRQLWRLFILKVKRVIHVFSFLQLKGERLIRNIFRKPFEEKYQHTQIALNFVLKQYFSLKKHIFTLILANSLLKVWFFENILWP